MFFASREYVNDLRIMYPEGSRVMCDHCNDFFNPIDTGDCGTVRFVDDSGTVHISWDSGRSLGLVPNEDKFHRIAKEN